MFAEEKGRYQDYDSLEAAESFDFSQLRAGDWSKIKHVRTGILLLLIDKIVHTVIALSCLALLLYFQPMFLKELGKPGDDNATALGLLVGVGAAFICFAGCPIFLSGTLAFVGTALCTDVPQVTGAKKPMIISIVCYGLLSFAGKFAGQIHPMLGVNIPLESLMVLVIIPLWLAAYTAFTLFLVRLARFFKATHLPKRITTVTLIQVLFLGMLFVSVGADGLGKIKPAALFSLLIGVSAIYLTWTLMSVWVYSGYYKMLGNLPLPGKYSS
jgi:hypothetical protein